MNPGGRVRKPNRRLTLEEVEASRRGRSIARTRFRRRVVIVVSIAVVAILLVAFFPYLPVSISGQVWTWDHYCSSGVYCPAVPNVTKSLPTGPNVALRWVDSSGGIVTFNLFGPGWPLRGWVSQCTSTGSSGGCSFSSVGGDYLFSTENNGTQSPQLVNFTLKYFVSLL